MSNKKILYVDMDGVVANFKKGVQDLCTDHADIDWVSHADNRVDEICRANPNIFLNLEPIEGSIDAVIKLMQYYDVYFLSAPMWSVKESFTDKRIWLESKFGQHARRRLILTHRKDFNIGHYLVDDSLVNGVELFQGEHIHFGSEKFPDWDIVSKYLLELYYLTLNKRYNGL